MELAHPYHTLGNRALLSVYKVAFLCSRNYPSGCRQPICDWAAGQCRFEGCVISGFHSSMEQQVLRGLLKERLPVILVLARGIPDPVQPEFQGPLAAGRLLIITRYASSVTHPCREKCLQRNRLMGELADEVVVGYATAGGDLERLCCELAAVKPVRYLWGAGG